jgi:hypothetical protein
VSIPHPITDMKADIADRHLRPKRDVLFRAAK